MSTEIHAWAQVKLDVAEVMAVRPGEYEASVVRNLDDLLARIEATNRPAPFISPGYWPTFVVTWEVEGAQNLQIEVFDDRYEISRFFEGRTDIWYEPHTPGNALSEVFIAELPEAVMGSTLPHLRPSSVRRLPPP